MNQLLNLSEAKSRVEAARRNLDAAVAGEVAARDAIAFAVALLDAALEWLKEVA